jgi:hypothetical protein
VNKGKGGKRGKKLKMKRRFGLKKSEKISMFSFCLYQDKNNSAREKKSKN